MCWSQNLRCSPESISSSLDMRHQRDAEFLLKLLFSVGGYCAKIARVIIPCPEAGCLVVRDPHMHHQLGDTCRRGPPDFSDYLGTHAPALREPVKRSRIDQLALPDGARYLCRKVEYDLFRKSW